MVTDTDKNWPEEDEKTKIKKRHREVIGKIIRELRKKKKWSQTELAQRLHVKSTGHISRVESGQIGLSSHLYPIAERELDLPPGYFMGLDRDFSSEELEIIRKFMDLMTNPDNYPQADAIKSTIKTTPTLPPEK
jgi:transcriptional regulator with XRE-family HTH domain